MVDICLTGLLNCSDVIGQIILSGANTVTGDMFSILMVLLLFLVCVCVAFGIPFELIGVIIIPICLVFGTVYSHFLAPLGVILIYFSFLIAKRFF
jgi:hypothetical protein